MAKKEYIKINFSGADEENAENFALELYYDEKAKSIYWSGFLPCDIMADPMKLKDACRLRDKLNKMIELVRHDTKQITLA